jgi:hypothetical protein
MLLFNGTATNPIIAMNGSVGQVATPMTLRSNQLIATSTAVQSIIGLTNGSNNLYLENNLISGGGAAGSYIVSGSGTDIVSYSANTVASTTNSYSPSLYAATALPLDTPRTNSSTWNGPTGGFNSLAASAPGTLLATGSINQSQLGYVWASATVSGISTAAAGTMNAYIQIANYTGPAMSYPYSSSGAAINYSLNYRAPIQIGPTGAVPIQVYGYDANTPTVNQVNLFGLGNLS